MEINPNSTPEHSAWVEDWTNNLDAQNYIDNLPKGVNTINIFVGQLDIVNGQPTIDGFSEDTPGRPAGTGAFPNMAALKDFVSKLKAKGIEVKLSIGGQAGTAFGQSWKKLTADNVGGFAKALVNLCQQTGADGIDFDDELEDTNIGALAGKLAAQFKEDAPDLHTSFCVYGGCSDSGPMHAVDSSFLQNAKLPDGSSAIDRVYVMTYYDGCSLSENEQFMLNWKNWLSENCGITAPQISIGADPNDPTTSPSNSTLKEWIDFAKKNDFGTALWDQQGVNDYVQKDWGDVVNDLYNKG